MVGGKEGEREEQRERERFQFKNMFGRLAPKPLICLHFLYQRSEVK